MDQNNFENNCFGVPNMSRASVNPIFFHSKEHADVNTYQAMTVHIDILSG
jgi:hypothetical protein